MDFNSHGKDVEVFWIGHKFVQLSIFFYTSRGFHSRSKEIEFVQVNWSQIHLTFNFFYPSHRFRSRGKGVEVGCNLNKLVTKLCNF